MNLSAKGAAFIKGFEACRLTAYLDSHVPPIWTIGWGHTGPEVHEGLVWSQQQADAMFLAHDVGMVEAAVNDEVLVALTQNQFDALVSLVYNIGATAFRNSTLLRLLNGQDYKGASAQFLVWNHSGGAVSTGLTRRRIAEKQVFDALAPTVSAPVVATSTAPNFLPGVLNFLSSLFKKGS